MKSIEIKEKTIIFKDTLRKRIILIDKDTGKFIVKNFKERKVWVSKEDSEAVKSILNKINNKDNK